MVTVRYICVSQALRNASLTSNYKQELSNYPLAVPGCVKYAFPIWETLPNTPLERGTRCSVPLRRRCDQGRQQVRHIGRSQAGDCIPTRRSIIAGDRRVSLIVTRSDIEVIVRILDRIIRDLVERRIDVAQISTSHLI